MQSGLYLLIINLNIITRSSGIVIVVFHIDLPFKCTTGIFYVNSNNGRTEFEDGTKIDCVANRMITFPSHMRHAGVTTTDSHCKVLINFNYFEVIQHDSSVQENWNYYGNSTLKENGSNK